MAFRNRLDRYDEHGQDTWTSPDEELFAAEMGQPSTEPPLHHGLPTGGHWSGEAEDHTVTNLRPKYPAVLCQTPVTCAKCGHHAVPFEDVIVCVDGGWLHDECVEQS